MQPLSPNSEGQQFRPERSKTDDSLRSERSNADEAVAKKRKDVQQNADAIVEHARERADAVLETARNTADAKSPNRSADGGAVARKRVVADELLQSERTAADTILRREREDEADILAALLPEEREKTDRDLLTERARSDHALANRDDFLGMVSHDLRNLLHLIALNAAALAQITSDSEESRQTVARAKHIKLYVARMNRLVGDLIDVVSIDAGKLAIRPVRSDVVALIAEAVDGFALTVAEKRVTLKSEVERDLLAEFDPDRMLQVLANLISNALKFTPRGGEIIVRCKRAGAELHFSVSDTGTGIPDNMLKTVFERFWQVDENDQKGLGLGLYISKSIVAAHGGRIWAESKLGEGSAFRFTIPCTASATVARPLGKSE